MVYFIQGAFFYCSALKMTKCQPQGNLRTVPPQKQLRLKKVKVPELFRTVPLPEMTKEKVQVTQLLIDLGNRDFMNRLTKCSACGSRRVEINTALSSVINIYWGMFCPMFRRIASCLSENCELNPFSYFCPEKQCTAFITDENVD